MKVRFSRVARCAAALILGATVVAPLTSAPSAGAHPAAREDAFTFSGTTGARHSVALQGGRYVISVFALYPGVPPSSYSTCSFTAALNGVEHPIPGGHSVLGSLPVGAMVGYRFMPTLNLPGGHYILDVSALTNCNWTVSIGGGGTGHPVVSFGNTGIFHMLGGRNEKTTIVETNNTSYSFGFSYNAWGDGFNLPTASMAVLQGGRISHTYTLDPTGGDNGQTAFSIARSFPPVGGDRPGPYTVRYSVALGGKTFTKSVNYTVQNLAPGKWAVQPSGTAVVLTGIACPSSTTCMAAGKAGTILATTNGHAWTRRSTSLGQSGSIGFSAVTCPTTRTCYVVGDQYFIFGSQDGGQTWSKQAGDDTYTSYQQNFFSVRCPSERRCYAVGSAGIIAATTDGGANWNMQAKYGSGKDLSDVECPTATTCIAVGLDGTILRTTNGGETWQHHTVGTAYLFSIDCPSVPVCFATGEGGTILHSTDGGTSWARQNNPYEGSQVWVDSVSCSSVLTCHAVGNSGSLLITSDGGRSWRDQATPVDKQLNLVTCASTQTCYAVGNGGIIVKGA